ncbi:hypothetical protein NDU88_005232 [Pleurodeles waltl]|uniref:Uncharacterized protein n=1 Tax=Pleurodeles waltl TaxID=8319 RepID=A0AAV7MIT1_PLEWA|nr:hypothetical protein NDU88_005232 [Pleurodeles waltl]
MQARLQFEQRKTQGPAGDGTAMGLDKGPEDTPGEEQDLKQLLMSMQHSLNQIDGKIDALAYRMDRMSKRIDKHTERLDHVENRVSAAEDGQTELAGGQMKLNRELSALKLKVQEARRKLIEGKKQLRFMHLEYRMLYPAKLKVDVDGSQIFFTDPKKLEHFVKRRRAGGGVEAAADEDL